MFDVNQITTTLRGMPDRALQQYAAMNKGNPYVLALAVAESNQRKQLRTAAQGQAGAQPMPKVADQDIAAMAPAQQLPEQQGIGQLPAPNMQHMADGGIAGYGDDANEGMAAGGSMFDFAQRSEPVLRMSGGGAVPRYNQQGLIKYEGPYGGKNILPDTTGYEGMSIGDFISQFGSDALEKYQKLMSSEGEQARKKKAKQDALAKEVAKNREYVAGQFSQYPTAPNDPRLVGSNFAPSETVAAQPAPSAPPSVSNTPAPPAASGAASGAGTEQKAVPGGPSLKNASTPMETGLGNLNTMVGEARRRFLSNANSTVPEDKSIADRLAERQALMPQGKAMEEYEASIKKEAEAEPEEKKQAGLMALTQGFLAVAAGESPYALTNLAKGMGLGLKEYGDSLKEFKKANKERQKQMAEIEHARRAEARGDVDAATKSYETAQEIEQRRRASIDAGLASLESHGISGAYSLAGHEVSGRYSLAGHQVSANAQKDWIKEIKGGQLVEKAMSDLRAQIEKSNKYGTPEEKDAAFKTMWPQVLQMNPGLAKYAGGIGGNAMPTGANFVFNPQTGQLEPGK